MLKLTASFSKKVPVEGTDYSSQSYHAAVEVEIPDGLAPEALQSRIRETFELVRTSVESELGNSGTAETPDLPEGRHEFPEASPKQIKFLTDIALQGGMDIQALNAEARRKYGVESLTRLDRRQASEFIDIMSGNRPRTRRKAA